MFLHNEIRRWLVSLAAFLVLAVPLVTAGTDVQAASAQAAPAKVYKWRIQTLMPPRHPLSRVAMPYWIEKVKKASAGRIEITQFPPASLVPVFGTFKGVAKGVLEMASTGASYNVGFIPSAEMGLGWPSTFEKLEELNYFMFKAGMVDVMRRAYAEKGVYYLGPGAPIHYAVPLIKKPIKTLADLKGLKIRSVGVFGELLQKLGASPVMIPMREVYTAMSSGVIDGAILGGPASLRAFKLFELGKYAIWPPIQRYAYIDTIINLKIWNSLPNDLKVILEATHNDMRDYGAAIMFNADINSLNYAVEKYGVKLVRLPDSDRAKFRRLAMEALDARAKNDKYSAELVEIYKKTLKRFGYIK